MIVVHVLLVCYYSFFVTQLYRSFCSSPIYFSEFFIRNSIALLLSPTNHELRVASSSAFVSLHGCSIARTSFLFLSFSFFLSFSRLLTLATMNTKWTRSYLVHRFFVSSSALAAALLVRFSLSFLCVGVLLFPTDNDA